ncbi:MAG: hypothetical protein EBS42_03185 [Caulobacteraceae bacterium]|nr:hypothetical protein [Caulobacteraceae bacterium]
MKRWMTDRAPPPYAPPLNLGPRGDLFVGWADPGLATRRNLLLTGLGLAVAGGAAAAIAGPLGFAPGAGRWDPSAIKSWSGLLILDPYPTLVWRDDSGADQAALLGCPDKCGVRAQVEQFADRAVTIRGSLIERSGLKMIAATLEPGWIKPQGAETASPAAAAPTPLGTVDLQGELMDAKCWLGAMRPGEGLTHRSCAILCVRMGLPLLFVAGPPGGRRRAFVAVDQNGAPFDESVLPFVADPVRVSGQALSWRGWPRLSFPVSALSRL